MKQITLRIENLYDTKTVSLNGVLSVGRTNAAELVLDDTGLSRINTTIFREGDEVFAADENSTNGTFIGGKRIGNAPHKLIDGDEISLGSHTKIFVEIKNVSVNDLPGEASTENKIAEIKPVGSPPPPQKFPIVLAAAIGMFFVTAAGALIAYLLVSRGETEIAQKSSPSPPPAAQGQLIPVRVFDPLSKENIDDLDDLIASWEGVEEEELNAANVDEVKAVAVSGSKTETSELNVPIDFWVKQKNLAFGARNSPVGLDPGLKFFPELVGGNVYKQKLKLSEMIVQGYKQPMDFSDLAEKRIKGELIELPIATDRYFLDVGGSASEDDFTAYSFETDKTPIAPGSSKYKPLQDLANNFSGQKYDLNNGRDRRQMRIRLLRMFHPNAKPVLEELAKAYQQKFGRPLRVTSLTRSMDYQIGLNVTNANSFKVRGPGSLPPHTSGCAFDLARKHMTADEQNFVQEKLVEMEKRGLIDALREGGANACFHVFIYPDGRPPKG